MQRCCMSEIGAGAERIRINTWSHIVPGTPAVTVRRSHIQPLNLGIKKTDVKRGHLCTLEVMEGLLQLQESLTIAESLAPGAGLLTPLGTLRGGHEARWVWNKGGAGVPVTTHLLFTVNDGGFGRSTAHLTHPLFLFPE